MNCVFCDTPEANAEEGRLIEGKICLECARLVGDIAAPDRQVLSFDKPKKVRSTEQHNATFQSDSGVAGTYVPNMSRADRERWKAKQIGGKDPRVEIRKTIGGTQLLMVVRSSGAMQVSMNGKLTLTAVTFQEMNDAYQEAWGLLNDGDEG